MAQRRSWTYSKILYQFDAYNGKAGCSVYCGVLFKYVNNSLQVLSKIDSGFRLAPPPGCPRQVYALMMDCW